MHVPDGFIDLGTSAGAGALAVAGLGLCATRARAALEDRGAPLAGLVAAFVFAVQMLNFPVAAGTSGHLLGGTLAAVLCGPWVGAVCVAVVVCMQVFFADGGVTALGLNVVNMALVTALGGYGVFLVLRRVLPGGRSALLAAAGVAAGASVVLSAVAFSVEYAVGGTGGAPSTSVAGAMIGVHALVGVGEGLITGLAVGAVIRRPPPLVPRAGRRGRATPPVVSLPGAA